MKGKDLKNSILQMAVQGKLVPQDPGDEPASVLLGRIREERRRLIAEGKLKAPKGGESVIYRASDGSHYEKRIDAKGRVLSDECIEDDIPFEIPESWEWVRLETLSSVLNGDRGKNYPAKSSLHSEGIPFVSAVNISNEVVVEDDLLYMNENQYSALRAGILSKGDFVFCIRGSLGKFGVFPLDKGAIASSLVIVRSHMASWQNDGWLHLLLGSPLTRLQIELKDNGTAQPNLSAKDFGSFLYAIPPLAEQRRIVRRLKKVALYIEEFGKLEAAREQLDAELPDRLRKSILQQAVQGRLAPQDPADEPASVLLGRIREERRRLIAEGKLKAPKGGESVIYRASDGSYYEKRVDAKGHGGEPVCIDDEIPFAIPDSWEWVRISSIGEVVGGGTPKTHDASLWGCKEHGISWVTPADMKHVKGIYVEAGERYISDEGLSSSSARLLPIGSVLMSSRAPIGYVAIASAPIATNQGFKSIVPYIAGMSLWLYWVIQSRMDNIKERATGTTFKEISGNEFGMTLIPLPPCKEQFDICSSIKKLLEIATNQ